MVGLPVKRFSDAQVNLKDAEGNAGVFCRLLRGG